MKVLIAGSVEVASDGALDEVRRIAGGSAGLVGVTLDPPPEHSRSRVPCRQSAAAEAEAVRLLERVRDVLRGSGWDASPEFTDLLRRHSLAVLDAQLRLDDVAGEAEWWMSQNDGTITLGDLVAEVQFIGSESERPHEWMWAWANENVDAPLAASAQQLRTSNGYVPEFAQPRFRMPRGIDGHAIATVATGLLKADAYYRAPHPGGSVFVMLRMPATTPLPAWTPLHRAGATLRAAPLALLAPVGIDDVAAYLRDLGVEPSVTDQTVSVLEPDGELVVRFDGKDRIASIDSELDP